MFYSSEIDTFPKVIKSYTVIRKTVWKIADPYHILLYIRSGSCIIEFEGDEFVLNTGDIFYIPENTVYLRRPHNDEFCEIVYVHFTLPSPVKQHDDDDLPELINSKLQYLKDCYEHNTIVSNGNELFLSNHIRLCDKTKDARDVFDEILHTIQKRHFHSYAISASLLSYLLLTVSDITLTDIIHSANIIPKSNISKKLKAVISYIHSHYKEKIELKDLCAVSFVSKQMLSKDFKKHFGTSPINYINTYRVEKAKEMLLNDFELSVKEVGAELGFEDQCYFSRAFKKVTGESPTQYRVRVSTFSEKEHINKK